MKKTATFELTKDTLTCYLNNDKENICAIWQIKDNNFIHTSMYVKIVELQELGYKIKFKM